MARATDPAAKHRRDVWLYMVLPVAGIGVLILLMLIGLFTLAATGQWSAEQIETIAGILMIVCVLTPLVVVMLALNALMVVIAVGTGKIPAALKPALASLRNQSIKANAAVQRLSRSTARPFIGMTARWTKWEQSLTGIVQPNGNKGNQDKQERQQLDERQQ